MANEFIENRDYDLAPIVANLQNHLDELQKLRQSSENADEKYKNGCIVYNKCKNVINDRDNEEKEVCCWPQNLFINFNFVAYFFSFLKNTRAWG